MWFVGPFDPVLELVIFGRQKPGDLIISGSYVAKRRPVSDGLPNLKLMAAHVVFLGALRSGLSTGILLLDGCGALQQLGSELYEPVGIGVSPVGARRRCQFE